MTESHPDFFEFMFSRQGKSAIQNFQMMKNLPVTDDLR